MDNSVSERSSSKFNMIMLIVISFLRFWGDSYFYGFLGRYLKTLGVNSVQLGVLLSIIPFMAVIGNLVISKIGTTMQRNRKIILIWTLVESSFIIASGFYQAFWFVVLFDVMCNFCSNSFYNMFDTFIMPIAKKDNKTYGFGRMWGTFAYIFGTFSGGVLIENISYKYTFVISGVMMLLGGILFMFLKFKDFADEEEEKKVTTDKPKYRELFTNKTFIVYMIAASILIGCNWAGDNAYILYTAKLDIPPSLYGYSFGLAIVMEAIGLLVFSKIQKVSTFKILIICACAALILKNSLMAIPNMNVYVYLVAEGLRGVTYGLVLTANLNLIQHILGKRLMMKGFFITIAIDELISATLDFFMPSVSESFGFTPIFLFIVGLLIISLTLVIFLKLDEKSFDERQIVSVKEN